MSKLWVLVLFWGVWMAADFCRAADTADAKPAEKAADTPLKGEMKLEVA
jgi:hypothetical protein